jgi:hypothetical protein
MKFRTLIFILIGFVLVAALGAAGYFIYQRISPTNISKTAIQFYCYKTDAYETEFSLNIYEEGTLRFYLNSYDLEAEKVTLNDQEFNKYDVTNIINERLEYTIPYFVLTEGTNYIVLSTFGNGNTSKEATITNNGAYFINAPETMNGDFQIERRDIYEI